MKVFILLLCIFGLTLSKTVKVYTARYLEEYDSQIMNANEALYIRLPTYKGDEVFVQFRVPHGTPAGFKVDVCAYTSSPSDDQIIKGGGACALNVPGQSFTVGAYDYYKYPVGATSYYLGFCITFLRPLNHAIYYFDSAFFQKELDSITRVVYGSALNADASSKLGVAYTIVNRAEIKKTSCDYEARKPSTFKFWKSTMIDGKQKTACYNAALYAYTKAVADPTKGATHFYEGYNMPSWASGKIACAKIGNYKFFKNIPF